jgi:GT2 family glycosyltransferase
MPKVGVVISMLNFPELTTQCVASVLSSNKGKYDIEIVIIDDGSDIPYHYPDVTTLRFDKPNGNTHSMNAGIEYFTNIGGVDYIYNLDNDTIVAPEAISELVKVMEKQPNLAAACSARLTEINGVMKKLGRSVDLIRGACEPCFDNDTTALIHWGAGCCMMMRTDVIRQIGMFDRRFKNYCQDSEWQLRALMNGYTVAIVPSSEVRHIGEVTMHANLINNMPDNEIFMKILSGAYIQEILEYLPLDAETRKYGKLTFDTFNKPTTT